MTRNEYNAIAGRFNVALMYASMGDDDKANEQYIRCIKFMARQIEDAKQ